MAWVSGSLDRTFIIDAPLETVLAFFSDPEAFKAAFVGLESATEVETGVWHWRLEKKTEKGVTFQPDYKVRYHKDSDTETRWEYVDGNIKSSGNASFRSVGDRTEVSYSENMSADLPIPRLAAKVFGPIVGKQVTAGVGEFLDRAKSLIEAG